jgi:hypothetical protein
MLVGHLSLLLVLSSCSPPEHPRLAEVFYDAAGDDSGLEFVELLNLTGRTVPLLGLRLEAGDGSGPGRWTSRWTGSLADSIAPGARFVIGGARVVPPPHSIASLDLQNGPDAVRLVWLDGSVEVVGYGVHEFAEYSCGAPAADVPSGSSLARVPDESDRGGNAADFRASIPSPGRANQPSRDAALVRGSLLLKPEQPEPGATARLSGTIHNRGREPFPKDGVLLTAGGSGSAWLERAVGAGLAAGDSIRFDEPLGPLAEGVGWVGARVALAGDEVPQDDADSILVRVGAGPLEITEIQFHPAQGEGEWVEVRNRSGVPLDPGAFTLSDRGPARGMPSATAGALAPESLAVLVQSRAAFLARFPGADTARVWAVAPWASLNNSDDSTGIADIVTLRDTLGVPCDRVGYSAAGVPTGVPLERRDGVWMMARLVMTARLVTAERLAKTARLVLAGFGALVLVLSAAAARAQDFEPPAPAGRSDSPLALLEWGLPAVAPRLLEGSVTRWLGSAELVTRAVAAGGGWRSMRAAAGISQTGDPEIGWTAGALALGVVTGHGGAALRAAARRDRHPDPPPGPLGAGIGVEVGGGAWVEAGAGVSLWVSAPEAWARGAAPPRLRGLEAGATWRLDDLSAWLTHDAPPRDEPGTLSAGAALGNGPLQVWLEVKERPIRGALGIVAAWRRGLVISAALEGHPVLGETARLSVGLARGAR